MDVAAWLQGLGLERYVPAFRDNEIDWEVLPKLTSEDLREIGVAAIGHRRKLLGGISSVSLGVRGAHLTFGRRGHRATIGLPGTGLFYTEQEPYRSRPSRPFLVVAIIVVAIVLFRLLS